MSKWISVKEYLPLPEKVEWSGREVLVRRYDGIQEVKHILMCEYWISGSDEHGFKPCWYPNGTPIENTTHWRELPEFP